MEQQVLQLLQATTRPDTAVIRDAEQSLLRLYPQQEFPFALLTIASHNDIESSSRKAALTALKNYVSTTWSPQFDETFTGQVYLSDEAKARVREQVFAICTLEGNQAPKDATIQALAAGVASKIATVDFPDAWPSLFPSLLTILETSTDDAPIHGALRVLAELVDEGLTEEQFFVVARDLVNALQHVAVDHNRGLIVRAMTLNVFRACFEMLEMVMADHGAAVKQFLTESLKAWMPFFMETLKQPLPEIVKSNDAHLRGLVALKVQVVKARPTLDKLRSVYVQAISPHATALFEVVWQELSRLAEPYAQLFIEGSAEGKLVDSDNLPCSLDALVLEELDFLQITIKAPPVRKELSAQMQQFGDAQHTVPWLQELIRVLVLYARIPKEEEALWEYDANLYLCEASSVTANYTPRAACAELAVRSLGEWLKQLPIVAMLHLNQHHLQPAATWKERESLLYLLNQSLKDMEEVSGKLDPQTASVILEQVSSALQDPNLFLRAAAQMVLGCSFKITGNNADYASAGAAAFTNAITASVNDPSDVVKVACFLILPDYIEALPSNITRPMQSAIINVIGEFISSRDLRDELEDADDVKAALIQLLRDAIMLDTSTLTSPDSNAIDLFFTLASDGASNFQLFTLLTEAFEGIVSSVSTAGQDQYIRLCARTIPSLTGAFDIANMTQESSLTNLAAELVSALAEFGSDPLPAGFVQAVMPKLQRVLMEATEAELVRPATLALNHMLSKGTAQFLEWRDSTGKSSIEVTLTIINRLLNSADVDENAGQEVGGLASSLVSKFGADKMGPYLMDLLRAVAIRLATAERIQFIQSLCMVFAGLALAAPKEVVDFLAEVNINGQNGLAVVLTRWLENSVHFAGFDEVRQNVVALSKVFALHDLRVRAVHVKGDLIVDAAQSGRIKTRSQAKLNPDRFSSIPADLKILKIMVDELASAATSRFPDLAAAQAAADALDEEDDEADDADEWEDVGSAGAVDLASAAVRSDLMSLAKDFGDDGSGVSPTGSRARDEETAEYLLNWFKGEAGKERFLGLFEQLSEEEKGKLRQLVA